MELNLREADIAAIFDKGLQAHNAGDLSAAEQLYQETLAIKPEHPEANHNIGVVLVAKNELDKALEFFKLAVTASPNVSLFWASYIDTLAKLERIIEAKALIKAARSSGMSCENIEAISSRLDIENQEPLAKDTHEIDEFITQQKFDDAIEACLSFLETYPSSGILNITLGKCYFELGQMELAISSYTNATE
jgi:predicted Zn-dependent protease